MSRKILAAVDDLFFAAKIRATAEAVGVEINFAQSKAALLEMVRDSRPDLVMVDLHNQRLDPLSLAEEIRSDVDLRHVPLLGFFSHVHTDLQRNALTVGYNQVMPRSVFSRDLAAILSGQSG